MHWAMKSPIEREAGCPARAIGQGRPTEVGRATQRWTRSSGLSGWSRRTCGKCPPSSSPQGLEQGAKIVLSESFLGHPARVEEGRVSSGSSVERSIQDHDSSRAREVRSAHVPRMRRWRVRSNL